MTKILKVEPQGAILKLILNRPEAFNALDAALLSEIHQALTNAALNDTIRAIIISGEGKAFCAGGDLKTILNAKEGIYKAFYYLAGILHQAVVEIQRMKKPIIAAINGVAAGGGFSLALACDYRVMGKSAFMKQAYTSAGLSLDGGGSYNLPRLIGHARAMELIGFDEPISATKALELGLVTKVVENSDVMPLSVAMAETLVERSGHAFGQCKALLTSSFGHTLETHLEIERRILAECGGHPQGTEGLKAFSEKRKPSFYSK